MAIPIIGNRKNDQPLNTPIKLSPAKMSIMPIISKKKPVAMFDIIDITPLVRIM
jgi:hypothetical protein